jgi:arylsulfatase A-like enzyme
MNLAPLLEDTSSKLERQAIFFHLPHYHHINTMGPSGAVRAGDYKLIEVFETGKKELYNLKQDIGETQDLSQEKAELVEQLSQMIEEWRKSSGSQMATLNPDYNSDKDWRKAP